MEAAQQHRVQRRKLLCLSEELEEERSRKLSNLDAAPLCCRCSFRLSRACLAPGGWAGGRVEKAGGAGEGWQVGTGEAGCCAGKVSLRFSARDRRLLGNEGPAAARSEIQLAAAVCFSWSKGASETL